MMFTQCIDSPRSAPARVTSLFLGYTLCMLVLFGASESIAAEEAVSLVKNNQPTTAILIPEEAISSVRLAAEELQYHIHKATGATLPIHAENDKPPAFDHFVYLGNCRKTAEVGIELAKLPPSGHLVKTLGGDLFLAGKDRHRADPVGSNFAANWQGTLFAVYDLLENDLGVRWLWPGELGEVVPKTTEITLGPIDRKGRPRFWETRLHVPKYPPATLGWASEKNKKKFFRDQDTFLLRHRFASVENLGYGHCFGKYWKRFGKTHPEFFNKLPNGKREPLAGDQDGKNITMCVSQPALWRQIVSDWKKRPDRDPDHIPYRPMVNCCENDTPGMCTCKTCRSWDAPDPEFAKSDYWGKNITPDRRHRFTLAMTTWGGAMSATDSPPSLSDRYARFYLSVLKEAKKVDPDARVIGYAYANYWKAPRDVKLDSDVIISHVPPLWFPYTEEQSRTFRESWDGWRKAGVDKIRLRPNLTHAGANLPVFYAKRLAADFSHAAQNGMIATGFDSLLGAWSAQGPTLYTLARIHEHPDWSPERILDEYYSGFGPAKQAVQKYFEHWEKHSRALDPREVKRYCREENGGSFKNYVRIAHRLFPSESFAEAHRLLAIAQQAAQGDALAQRRVAYLEKGLIDAQLTTATRAAQARAEKNPSRENQKAFEAAFQKLVAYRASIEADNVCNFGHAAYREKYGAGWEHE